MHIWDMKYWGIIFMLLGLSVHATEVDSLQNILKNDISDSLRFEVQVSIFKRVIFQDLEGSFAYVTAQKKILDEGYFKEDVQTRFLISYHINSGVYYNRKGNASKSLENYEKALQLANNEGNTKDASTVLNNIANIYYRKGDYQIALDYHLRSLEIRREENDTMGIAMSMGNIGLIYDVQNDYDQAIFHYQEALTYFNHTDNQRGVAWIYRSLGTAFLEMKKYDLAKKNFHRSMDLCQKLSDLSGEKYCLLNLGVVNNDLFLESNDSRYLDSADYYLNLLPGGYTDERIEVNYLNYKARVLVHRKDYLEALKFLDKSINVLENSALKTELKEVFNLKYQAHTGLKNYEDALINLEKFKSLNDEIFSIEKDKEMGRKQAEFDYKEKLKIEKLELQNQKELHQIKQEKQTLIIAVISLSFLISILGFAFFYRKKNQQTIVLAKERDEIVSKYLTLEDAYLSVLKNLEELQESAKPQETRKKELPDWATKLSKRELEVLSCLAVGMSDNEIHEKLFVSVSTVRTHCQRIYNKLLVKNRMEASNMVREYGLI